MMRSKTNQKKKEFFRIIIDGYGTMNDFSIEEVEDIAIFKAMISKIKRKLEIKNE